MTPVCAVCKRPARATKLSCSLRRAIDNSKQQFTVLVCIFIFNTVLSLILTLSGQLQLVPHLIACKGAERSGVRLCLFPLCELNAITSQLQHMSLTFATSINCHHYQCLTLKGTCIWSGNSSFRIGWWANGLDTVLSTFFTFAIKEVTPGPLHCEVNKDIINILYYQQLKDNIYSVY